MERLVRRGGDLFTVNLEPGRKVYGEDLVQDGGTELRRWDPWRSKLAALLLRHKGFELPEHPQRVLYLGGAHGTTVSHLSDLWPETPIFAVEKSPVAFASLLALARRRSNLMPLLADAQLPERYSADVEGAEFVYQDVAQRAQATIFIENLRACAAAGSVGLLMLKTRSVTQRRPPSAIVAEARAELSREGFAVPPATDLSPYSRDHAALTVHL
jgi:fibrillarin-like pre-rRNA processing protein